MKMKPQDTHTDLYCNSGGELEHRKLSLLRGGETPDGWNLHPLRRLGMRPAHRDPRLVPLERGRDIDGARTSW